MPIHVVTGVPGSGKSYFATYLAHKWIARGALVAANYPMNVPGVEYYPSDELFEQRGTPNRYKNVIHDEAQQTFHSRNWKNAPEETYQSWNMVRRGGLNLWLLTQNLLNLDSTLRRSVHYVWNVAPLWKTLSAWREEDQHPIRIRAVCYSSADYGKAKARKVRKRTIWFRKDIAASYDTLHEFSHTWGGETGDEPDEPDDFEQTESGLFVPNLDAALSGLDY